MHMYVFGTLSIICSSIFFFPESLSAIFSKGPSSSDWIPYPICLPTYPCVCIFLPVYLSVCPCICLYACLPNCMPIYLCLPVCLYAYLPMPVCLSICLCRSAFLPVWLFAYLVANLVECPYISLVACQYIGPLVCLYVHMPVCLSVGVRFFTCLTQLRDSNTWQRISAVQPSTLCTAQLSP